MVNMFAPLASVCKKTTEEMNKTLLLFDENKSRAFIFISFADNVKMSA